MLESRLFHESRVAIIAFDHSHLCADPARNSKGCESIQYRCPNTLLPGMNPHNVHGLTATCQRRQLGTRPRRCHRRALDNVESFCRSAYYIYHLRLTKTRGRVLRSLSQDAAEMLCWLRRSSPVATRHSTTSPH